jgi:hypothetical protein
MGQVWSAVYRADRSCSTCGGDGFWPPMMERLIETVEDYDRITAIENDAG